MNEKIKCPNCKLLIDEDSITCPYCGSDVKKLLEEEKNRVIEPEIIEEKPRKKNYKELLKFESRVIPYHKRMSSYFLLGFLGFMFLPTIIVFILQAINPYFLTTLDAQAYLNFSLYFIIFGIFFFLLKDDLYVIIDEFKKKRTYLYGFLYGFLLIIVSVLVNLIIQSLTNSTSSNENQNNVVNITNLFPLLSFIVFGAIGPIVEELTYRVGLFGSLYRINKFLAYIATALIFGFLHFNFDSSDIINELINIPSYIVSGVLLCYFYEKEGIGASIIAHIVNNLVSLTLSFIIIY